MNIRFGGTRTLVSILVAGLFAVASLATAQADTYNIDGSHSFVVFKVNHLGIGNSYGMFRKTSGSYTVTEAGGSLDITIDAGSVFTADKKRDDHLKGPDFFNTKEFPNITFKSTKVERSGDKFKVTGDLTMKGKTKSTTITFTKTGEGKDPWGNYRTGFEGELRLNRMDFGVDYMPEGLGKEVSLMIAVEGVKK